MDASSRRCSRRRSRRKSAHSARSRNGATDVASARSRSAFPRAMPTSWRATSRRTASARPLFTAARPARHATRHWTSCGTVELEVVFAVDLFNEGLDAPHVDTVLMLRPTESPVVFLQQLGRGLRTSPGKEHLVVVDFIGNHRSFLLKPRTLLSLGQRTVPVDRRRGCGSRDGGIRPSARLLRGLSARGRRDASATLGGPRPIGDRGVLPLVLRRRGSAAVSGSDVPRGLQPGLGSRAPRRLVRLSPRPRPYLGPGNSSRRSCRRRT